ncbi:NTF2-like protein [Wolfiporia cocos MD-104 SS10]|uniref:NTF2-like protein n=1 Tax=Wolfiporia cocos (strain MD-104) TaxID=742152 RepID=A0A2H3IWD4_WOLCO|nr:NTF2-like protein [Wolfiporia cocos MD-104 SS10]
MTTLSANDVELAARAADNFTHLYYSTYDSATRVDDLPNFYRPTSSLTWNGKPFQGSDGVRELVGAMPPTRHEVQCFDCHPIPGSQPPNLLITVSGTVAYGRRPPGNSKSVDDQPRAFSQTFMLVPDPTAPPSKAGEVAKYYVNADALRFVG